MMQPSRRSSMPGSTARMVRTIDLTLRFTAKSSSPSFISRMLPGCTHAGAVEQHVDHADAGDAIHHCAVVQHVEPRGDKAI